MAKRILPLIVLCFLSVLAVHFLTISLAGEQFIQKRGPSMDFQLSSKAFKHNAPIPAKYTGHGPDVSPPLEWVNAPGGTRAFVLICDDPDAPVGTWVHWVLYDIPADTKALPEAMPKDKNVLGSAKQGRNDFGKIGYNGPAPPPGKIHRYFFKLYATDKETDLEPGATKKQALKTIEGHILAEAELIGTYRR